MPNFPIQFPPKAPVQEKLQLNFRQAAMESPHSLKFQVVNTASQWNLELNWNRMSGGQALVVQGFLDSLQGQVGSFRYTPVSGIIQNMTGRTLSLAVSPMATTARFSGFSANAASGLRVGQLFNLGDQLFRLTAAALNADASGQVVVEFQPPTRKQYVAGFLINFAAPYGVFRLANSETPSFTIDIDRAPSFPTLVAKEVI